MGKFPKGYTPWNKGKSSPTKGVARSEEVKAKIKATKALQDCSHSKEVKALMSENRKGKGLGEANNNWKGDKVGYLALHTWVQRTLGKPDTCKQCKATGLKGHGIHWANLSQEYKRDVSDWVRLCAWCHKQYDLGRLKLN